MKLQSRNNIDLGKFKIKIGESLTERKLYELSIIYGIQQIEVEFEFNFQKFIGILNFHLKGGEKNDSN